METKTTVWLLTTGDGSDGSEWDVKSIHATKDGAERAKTEYEKPRTRGDGSTYTLTATVEEWPVEE